MVLLVFAGSAAEFALNRAVDWLFFTGKLPGDPIGRLFATASYAQQIVFADELTATRTFDRIRAVHGAIEHQRGQAIPDWAHRDVLYMLIDYSERAHELLAGPLSTGQQNELYDVFYRVGTGLDIPDLPTSYAQWRVDREIHLRRDLHRSSGTKALYAQYCDQLGAWRYDVLLQIQALLVPAARTRPAGAEVGRVAPPPVASLPTPGPRRFTLDNAAAGHAVTLSRSGSEPGSSSEAFRFRESRTSSWSREI